jgi:hypothetical protein
MSTTRRDRWMHKAGELLVEEYGIAMRYARLWNRIYERIEKEAPRALKILEEEVDAAGLPAVWPSAVAEDGDDIACPCKAWCGTGHDSKDTEEADG